MKRGMLEKVKRLVQEVKVVYVATSDKEGVPHLAAAEGMTFAKEGEIVFRLLFEKKEWYHDRRKRHRHS